MFRTSPLNFSKLATVVIIAAASIIWTPVAIANVIGGPSQTFNPTYSSRDFVSVASSKTLAPKQFHLGLFMSGQSNTLPYFKNANPEELKQDRQNANDTLAVADLSIGFGLMRGWDLGISIPQILSQNVRSEEPHGQFAKNGVTTVRIASKVSLLTSSRGGLAVIVSGNINQTKQNPYTRNAASSTGNIELVVDRRWGRTAAALNVGYRKHMLEEESGEESETTGSSDPVPSDAEDDIAAIEAETIGSLALSYFASRRTQVISEVFASDRQLDSTVTDDTNRAPLSVESIFGLKFYGNTGLLYHLGVGTELADGVSSADWRGYLGLQWSPRWSSNKSNSARRSRVAGRG